MNAPRDENNRPTIICASKNDGQTITVIVTADATSHRLHVDDGTTGSDNGNNMGNAMLDENSVPVWAALSSDGSGNIIEIYGDPISGSVLVDSH